MDTEIKKSEITKKKIMQTAIRLFAKKDYSSVGTREIAKEAGVNLSLISYYFGSKDNLYSTIINRIIDLGLEFMSDELTASQTVQNLTQLKKIELYLQLLYKYIDFVYSERVSDNFVMLMLKEQTTSNSEFGHKYRKRSQILYNALADILSSITHKKPTDSEIIFEICTTMGEILSFKFLKKIVYKKIQREAYTQNDIEKIKKLLHLEIKMSLERFNIKFEESLLL